MSIAVATLVVHVSAAKKHYSYMFVVNHTITLTVTRYHLLLYSAFSFLFQVFYGFWRILCIKKPLGLHKIPYGSVVVFCLSLMAIMHAYEREKQSISPLINTSLKFLLGD